MGLKRGNKGYPSPWCIGGWSFQSLCMWGAARELKAYVSMIYCVSVWVPVLLKRVLVDVMVVASYTTFTLAR